MVEAVPGFDSREWKMAVLCNEIHGHVGIYSLLGVKMGLKAREIFEAEGLNGHISVVSFSGKVPPVSCLMDGIQISSGATLGHGLIELSPEAEARAEAFFRCGGKEFRLRLKPALEAEIHREIEQAYALYAHSPAYWQRVEKLALKYWSTWDRNSIFDCI